MWFVSNVCHASLPQPLPLTLTLILTPGLDSEKA